MTVISFDCSDSDLQLQPAICYFTSIISEGIWCSCTWNVLAVYFSYTTGPTLCVARIQLEFLPFGYGQQCKTMP